MTDLSTLKAGVLRLGQLPRDENGALMMAELALTLPLLFIFSFGGAEMANYTIAKMRVESTAVQLADNMARIGEGPQNTTKEVKERAINDAFVGAQLMAGDLDIFSTESFRMGGTMNASQNMNKLMKQDQNYATSSGTRGRMIVSNFQEMTPAQTPARYQITWQRCAGGTNAQFPPKNPANGPVGDYGTHLIPGTSAPHASGTNMLGMGPSGNGLQQAIAPGSTQVVFVQVIYRYEPIMLTDWSIIPEPVIEATAAAIVRQTREAVPELHNAADPDVMARPSTCS